MTKRKNQKRTEGCFKDLKMNKDNTFCIIYRKFNFYASQLRFDLRFSQCLY